jgi:hypothetical protein
MGIPSMVTTRKKMGINIVFTINRRLGGDCVKDKAPGWMYTIRAARGTRHDTTRFLLA